jgi:hypothetical protein
VAHTPGPWFVREGPRGRSTDIFSPSRPDTLATTAFHGWNAEEMEANAQLIAAAPDLLEALKAVIAISDRKHDAWDHAKAVIAEAEGK